VLVMFAMCFSTHYVITLVPPVDTSAAEVEVTTRQLGLTPRFLAYLCDERPK
jgi:hypothetical protein